jgi:rhodanese-related sulfurtransferase
MNRSAKGGCLTLVAICSGFLACQAAEHTKDELDAVKNAVRQKKAVLVDVREKAEWKAGHIEGAVCLPLSELRAGIDPRELARILPKDKIVYAHCASGRRCLLAADILKGQGYDVRALKPGYKALVLKGFVKAKE